jgi:hypothetical protein
MTKVSARPPKSCAIQGSACRVCPCFVVFVPFGRNRACNTLGDLA